MLLAREVQNLYAAVAKGLRPLFPLAILVLYTIIGALLFKYIEGRNELEEIDEWKERNDRLLKVIKILSSEKNVY